MLCLKRGQDDSNHPMLYILLKRPRCCFVQCQQPCWSVVASMPGEPENLGVHAAQLYTLKQQQVGAGRIREHKEAGKRKASNAMHPAGER